MSDQPGPAWEATDEDLADLPGFGAELLLRFDPTGRLAWANPAAWAALGEPDPPEGTPSGGDVPSDGGAPRTLDSLVGSTSTGPAVSTFPRAAGEEAPPVPLSAAASCPPGGGTGPHVSPVAVAGPASSWWEWRAWRDEAGTLWMVATDVTAACRAARLRWARRRTLETLLQSVAAGIAVRATDGRLVLANARFRQWFPDLSPSGSLSAAEAAVATAGVSSVTDESVDGPDGRRTLLTVRFPLRDGAGRVEHVATVATDITARIEIERELADQQRVLDTLVRVSPDIVALVDADRRLLEVSDAVYSALGLPGPVSQDQLAVHVHPDDVDRVGRWVDALLAGEDPGRCRHRMFRADGSSLHLETSGRRMVDDAGTVRGAVLVSRDVSAAVDVEVRLEQAAAAAEEANRAKSAFLSRISGQLRTPLQGVLAMAERLGRPGPGRPPLSAAQLEAVGHVERAGRHLQALIDEVLDVARLERRGVALAFEAVAVAPLVAEAVALVRPLGDGHGVRVLFGGDDGGTTEPGGAGGPWVWADRQRLLQVLLNLLSNAVKYNRPRGTVRVTTASGDGRVRVSVADTGVGIAPEHLDRLFEPFDRLGAEHSAVEGTGVGLTLTKHLVEQMGGSVEVRSAPGAGSVFAVELGAAPPPARSGEPSAAARAVRVLHVEDDPASGELVRQLLCRHGGVDLVQAPDGATALTLARRDRPDLVLLDLGLPDVGGESVLAELRADPVTAGIPVVVVSADATDGQVARLQAAGAAAYLTKPVAVGQLLALVDAAGGHRNGAPG